MDRITAADVIAVWEAGTTRPLAVRARQLVAMIGIEDDTLTIGERDTILMDLRARLFGNHVSGMAVCPACAEHLDLDFSLSELRIDPPTDTALPRMVEFDGYALHIAPPCVADLDLLASLPPDTNPHAALLGQCVHSASLDGQPLSPKDLPVSVVSHIEGVLAELDPQADIQLALVCPACRHSWSVAFDIVPMLWREIESLAWRLLQEVHLLASAYGWREVDILAMSPYRRAAYLDLVVNS